MAASSPRSAGANDDQLFCCASRNRTSIETILEGIEPPPPHPVGAAKGVSALWSSEPLAPHRIPLPHRTGRTRRLSASGVLDNADAETVRDSFGHGPDDCARFVAVPLYGGVVGGVHNR